MRNHDDGFIDARKYVFTPFPHPLHPDKTGDSGALEMATSKTDPNARYIVKTGYPELGCNEFFYHRVSEVLGLYTQEARLISGSAQYRRAAAFPFVPGAKLFDLCTSTQDNFVTFFKFEALYYILNESDSHEYYLDEQGRLFKLDNAASFTVEETTILRMEGNPIGRFFIRDINAPLHAVGYDYYGIGLKLITEDYGQSAAEAYLSVFRQFAEFDASILDEAYTALDKQYPRMLGNYYSSFIRIRKDACRRFLAEIGMGR